MNKNRADDDRILKVGFQIRSSFTLTAAFVVALAIGNSLDNPVGRGQEQLEWKFAKGRKLKADFTQNTETQTVVNDRQVKMTVGRQMEMLWLVESVDDDGTARIRQQFTRFRLKMQMGGADEVAYDSQARQQSSEAARDIAATLDQLVGKAFYLTMTSRGEITDVKLSEEAAAALEKAPKENAWKSQFTQDGIRQTLGQAAAILPEAAVNKGAKWSQSRRIDSLLGRLNLETQYTYEGPAQQQGRAVQKISLDAKLKFLTPARGKLEIKSQSQTGVLYFDAAAGRLAESRLTQQLTTLRPYRDQKIAVVANTTDTLKLTEVDPAEQPAK